MMQSMDQLDWKCTSCLEIRIENGRMKWLLLATVHLTQMSPVMESLGSPEPECILMHIHVPLHVGSRSHIQDLCLPFSLYTMHGAE